jgi:Flp pilus assembly protein TadD
MGEPLDLPETHCLSHAIGWVELGNLAEAEAELAQISPRHQEHPDVLEVRWLVHAERHQWSEGLQVAQALVERAPERPSGWLHRAYALRRVPDGTVQNAWEALVPAAERFPKEHVIAFNLACYACVLQDHDAARVWLKRAMKVAGKERIKEMALTDPDLEPLWDEIRQI